MKRKSLRGLIVVMIAALVFTMMPLTASAASKKPGKTKIASYKVSKVSRKNSTATVTVKWKRAKKATGYEVWEKHGTGEWTKLKRVGRLKGGMKIKRAPSGQYSVMVRAVRKVKGKTYYGKFSKSKSKFIKSPLTLEQLGNVYPALKKSSYVYETISFSGNTAVYTYDVNKIPAYSGYTLAYWKTPERRTALYDLAGSLGDAAAKDRESYRLNTGISGVGIKVRFVHSGTELMSRFF